MSRSKNTIKFSDISTAPVKLKYSASYSDSDFSSAGISIIRGINIPVTSSVKVPQFKINYNLIEQLFYRNYISGSLLFSGSAYDSSYQSTAASGTFDDDVRYFPTQSNAEVVAFYIPRNVFGEQIARNSFVLNTPRYYIYDDGNGNLLDLYAGNVKVGNIIYSQAFVIITNELYRCYCIDTSFSFTVEENKTPIVPSPSPTPTPSITPSLTITPTITPSISATPSITPTITESPSITPTVTSTPNTSVSVTPSVSPPSVSPTPSISITPSVSPPSISPTPSVTPSEPITELKVRGKYVNTNGNLQYQINTGSQVNIGALQSNCANVTNIGPLNVGDIVTFSDVDNKTIAGDSSVCPESGFGCTYQVTISSGTNWAYLTLDGSIIC